MGKSPTSDDYTSAERFLPAVVFKAVSKIKWSVYFVEDRYRLLLFGRFFRLFQFVVALGKRPQNDCGKFCYWEFNLKPPFLGASGRFGKRHCRWYRLFWIDCRAYFNYWSVFIWLRVNVFQLPRVQLFTGENIRAEHFCGDCLFWELKACPNVWSIGRAPRLRWILYVTFGRLQTGFPCVFGVSNYWIF